MVELYINGELKAQNSVSGTIAKPGYNTPMVIGCNPYGNMYSASMLKGKIYSARIYNRALT